ncbi:DUF2975 domain-containing protein [Aurantiacibacter luteus]|uniref:DUF2975 domain-containing protein n=1 Tax=Aurantiacibacter luteus TaxID=1581420 RepID=A0A0G9MZ42_9SPHN|nr:DUF2975 domain-containing protein [Aurantiacibacter luteus]KLE34548.1 hypothetical protein AAW00_10085 [Aurantiacibacter luteus]
MQGTLNDPLLLAGKVLAQIGKWLAAIAAAGVTLAIPILIVKGDDIDAKLRTEMGDATMLFPAWEAAGALALVLVILVLMFFFFDRLVRIVRTVGEGDPFQPANAQRLSQMGWLMLGVQVLTVPLGALGMFVARTFEEQGGTGDMVIDPSGIIMIVVLFILARVFRHGAAMREDLEGTV